MGDFLGEFVRLSRLLKRDSGQALSFPQHFERGEGRDSIKPRRKAGFLRIQNISALRQRGKFPAVDLIVRRIRAIKMRANFFDD